MMPQACVLAVVRVPWVLRRWITPWRKGPPGQLVRQGAGGVGQDGNNGLPVVEECARRGPRLRVVRVAVVLTALAEWRQDVANRRGAPGVRGVPRALAPYASGARRRSRQQR